MKGLNRLAYFSAGWMFGVAMLPPDPSALLTLTALVATFALIVVGRLAEKH